MTHIPPTPPETLARAHAIGLKAGLRFVYTDSVMLPNTANTVCPTCGTCVIERVARYITIHALAPNGSCAVCDTPLGIVTMKLSRSSQKEGLQ
jgi:pyruvate formate lyase activating enzyme